MKKRSYQFTSESVSEGHPDKVCDRISDAILDSFIADDPYSRVACETLATTNRVIVAGEYRGSDQVRDRIEEIVRSRVRDIGYEQEGFHWDRLEVLNVLHGQSTDIAQGVDSSEAKEEGAGDQGLMFGYAIDETPQFMPAPIFYAHRILRRLAAARRSGDAGELGPDSKSQLTIRYDNGVPVEITSLVLSAQHFNPSLESGDIRAIVEPVVLESVPEGWITPETEWWINPTGKFVIGGPDGDTGLTGRKIVVDTYGGSAPHGGGAFSGKDPTKVDRSASYAARYLAKNIVAAGLARRCCIQISYAIGVAKPLSLHVETYGTASVPEAAIEQAASEVMDLSPRGIREHLGLNRPIYERTSAYGHFGREPEEDGGFSWERTDLTDALKSLV